MTKTDLHDLPYREPGTVEAWQGDGEDLIPSELNAQTRLPSVGLSVQATSVPRACWSLKGRIFVRNLSGTARLCILTGPVSRNLRRGLFLGHTAQLCLRAAAVFLPHFFSLKNEKYIQYSFVFQTLN